MRLNPAQHSSPYSIQGSQLHCIRRSENSWCKRLDNINKPNPSVQGWRAIWRSD